MLLQSEWMWEYLVCVCEGEIEREEGKKSATISVENAWKNKNQTIQRNIWHVLSFVVRRCMLLNVHDTVFNLTLSSLLFTFSFQDVSPPILFVYFLCLFLLQFTRSFAFCSFALSFIVLAAMMFWEFDLINA